MSLYVVVAGPMTCRCKLWAWSDNVSLQAVEDGCLLSYSRKHDGEEYGGREGARRAGRRAAYEVAGRNRGSAVGRRRESASGRGSALRYVLAKAGDVSDSGEGYNRKVAGRPKTASCQTYKKGTTWERTRRAAENIRGNTAEYGMTEERFVCVPALQGS